MQHQANNPLEDFSEIITIRHQLHRLAERSGAEEKTNAFIYQKLKQLKANKIIGRIGGYGLAAVFKGKKSGPRVMFRADIDALPIAETNNFDYASENHGVSHKCGHDGHSAILLGLARQLSLNPPEKGEVVLLFQPAEETGMGANAVIDDKQFETIVPDFAFALHNLPGFEKHGIIWRDGVFAAASKGLQLMLKGRTAHASQPETGKSPACAMAEIIQAFVELNELGPEDDYYSAVTVTHARLGNEAVGTAPGEAIVWATLRSYKDDLLENLGEKCMKIAAAIAEKHGLGHSIGWQEPFLATVNSPGLNEVLLEAAKTNHLQLIEKKRPFRWSEDFGHFGMCTKTCLFGLGAGIGQPDLHNPDYDFPDELIETGVRLFDRMRRITNG